MPNVLQQPPPPPPPLPYQNTVQQADAIQWQAVWQDQINRQIQQAVMAAMKNYNPARRESPRVEPKSKRRRYDSTESSSASEPEFESRCEKYDDEMAETRAGEIWIESLKLYAENWSTDATSSRINAIKQAPFCPPQPNTNLFKFAEPTGHHKVKLAEQKFLGAVGRGLSMAGVKAQDFVEELKDKLKVSGVEEKVINEIEDMFFESPHLAEVSGALDLVGAKFNTLTASRRKSYVTPDARRLGPLKP